MSSGSSSVTSISTFSTNNENSIYCVQTEGTRIPVLLENDDMTYEFLSFERGGDSTKAALDETYAVPPEFGSDCERVAQDVGFPYIHLLHTFVRF